MLNPVSRQNFADALAENHNLKLEVCLILDFNCQPLGRVPICFMSVGPYGPGGVLSLFEGGEGVPKVFSRKDPEYIEIYL